MFPWIRKRSYFVWVLQALRKYYVEEFMVSLYYETASFSNGIDWWNIEIVYEINVERKNY